MNKKKLLSLALALGLTAALVGCGGNSTTPPASSGSAGSTAEPAGETTVLKVAASPTPHAEILAVVKDELAKQGIDLQVTEYGDYKIPNLAVDEGEVDANYFQHLPHMETFNKENGTNLVSVGGIHIEPIGIYAGKCKTLEELPDGAEIAIPNDSTNEGRALLLLQAQGLIKLKDSANMEATPNDIAENPKNIKFKELEAAMLPNSVEEVDLSVINSNYALQAGFNPVNDSLALENAENPYVNIIAVKEGNESNPAIVALVKALQSDAVKEYINTTYGGAVVPAF